MRIDTYKLIFLTILFSLNINAVAQQNSEPLIKVGVYDNPPKVFLNEKGEADGIFIDLIKSIAKKENIQVEYVYEEWATLQTMIQNGTLDVLPDVAYSIKRDSLYQLSMPVLSSWLQVFTTKKTIVNSILDLQNKKIGVLKGSIQEEYVKNTINIGYNLINEIRIYDDYSATVLALSNNEIDVIVANRFFYFSDLCDANILPTGVILQLSELHFAFPKNKNSNLVRLFDKNLSVLINNPDSEYYKSIQYWFSKHNNKKIPTYLIYVLASIGLIFLIISGFTILLQKKVKEKTKTLQIKNKELQIAIISSEESEAKHRFLFENMAHGVIYHDENGAIIEANQAAASILGVSLNDLLDASNVNNYWQLIHEDGTAHLHKNHPAIESLRTNTAIKNTVMGAFNPIKKEYVWIIVNSIPKYNHNNSKPHQVIVTFEDITEIRNAKEKAKESDRLKSVFLQNMSHEIRTPMNGILGFINLLKDLSLNAETKTKYITIIKKSGERLLTTINNIIEISKIESNQITPYYEPINLSELMDYHFHFFEQQAKDKEILLKITPQIPAENTIIETDKNILNSIISNLLNNAIKFTNKGIIEFSYSIENDSIVFCISDTGVGIPMERQTAIFDRFVQANLNNNRGHEGSGLGLAIVKEYVTILQGKIWINSETSKGSKFYFSLPCKSKSQNNLIREDTTQKEVLNNTISKFGDKITLLVAEDDETSFLYIELILRSVKVNIIRATNGQEVIELLTKNPEIALILMDIKMPVLDGLETTRQIRLTNKEIPIIVQTAYALWGDREKAFEAGATNYITKPIISSKLINMIHEYLK